MSSELETADTTSDELRARIAALETALAAERARADALATEAKALAAERDRVREAYRQLQLEIALLRRRIFVAKAERVDTHQLELEFASKKAELAELVERIGLDADLDLVDENEDENDDDDDAQVPEPAAKPRRKPKGRRSLRDVPIEEQRVELLDTELEGKAERIGFEESIKLGYRKGGPVRVIVARAKYKVATATEPPATTIVTVPVPPEMLKRCLAAPSLLAKVATDKFCDGLPLYRQEERFARSGVTLDRGTMCRWLEDAGMTAGCVVLAMRREAMRSAFCIATDATGIAVQPMASDTGTRQPCRRGHYFVFLADQDHVFFEYTPRETSTVVEQMFRGFSGYVQADAKSVYDVLFRTPKEPSDDDEIRHEVACWSHARRKFYEAASAKDRTAREALFRIHGLFQNERRWKDLPPEKRKRLRLRESAPLIDDFFHWASGEYEKVKGRRGLLRSAFGYAIRQEAALRRFLEDGRLKLDNNGSEREIRRVAVGRKAWLFVGSDDHAEAAGNLLSLIASSRLHGLDPEAYLTELFRVLPHWPTDRYLELAPRYWRQTRDALDPLELAQPLGPLKIPAPPQQQPSSD